MGSCWSGAGHSTVALLASQTLHLARTTLNPTRLARRGSSRGQTRELRKLIMNEMVEQFKMVKTLSKVILSAILWAILWL